MLQNKPSGLLSIWLTVMASLALLLSIQGSNFAQQEKEDLEFYTEEAAESFEEADYEDVTMLVQEGLGFYPDNAELQLLDAKVKIVTGQYEDALKTITTQLKSDTNRNDLLWLQSEVQYQTGLYEDCLKVCETLLKQDENHFKARLRMGEVQKILGRTTESQENFEWFLEFYKSKEQLNGDEYLAVANACYFLRRWKDTNRLYDEALSSDKHNIDALLGHARMLMEKGNPTRANERLRMARKAKRMDPRVLTRGGEYELSQRRTANAKALLDRALSVNPNYVDAYCARALIELQRENPDAAFEDLTKAAAINPRHITTRALLAAAHFMNGNEAGYEEQRKIVEAFNPRCAEFYKIVGQYLALRLLVKESIEILEIARELDPTDYDVYHQLGVAYMRFGEKERAQEIMAEANENDPYSAWTYNYLELIDKMDERFVTLKTEHFVIRMDRKEAELLGPYLCYLGEQAFDTLTVKYGAELETPIIMESFIDHSDFAVRTIGMPGLGALGACWGKLATLYSPQKPKEEGGGMPPFSWAVTMWHEFTHIVHLQMSGNRIPRWLAEGNASYEQDKKYPSWDRDFDMQLVTTYCKKELPHIRNFNTWFYDGRVLFAYYLGSVYNEYIATDYGFDKLVAIINGCSEGKSILQLIEEVLDVTPEEYDKGFYDYVGRVVEPWKYAPVWGPKNVEEMRLQLASDENNIELLAHLADAYSSIGIRVDAELAMHKAMQIDPDHTEVLFTKARLAMRNKKTDEAMQLYEKAFSKGKDCFQIRFQLGMHYLTVGEKEKNQEMIEMGLEHLETAMDRFPAFSGEQGTPNANAAGERLIAYYKKAKNVEKEMYWTQKFADVVQTDVAKLTTLAKYFEKQGDTKQAIHYYWQVSMVNPWLQETHLPAARLMEAAGDYARAALEFHAAMFFDSRNLDLRVDLARCYLQLNRREEALELLQYVLRKDDSHQAAKALLETMSD